MKCQLSSIIEISFLKLVWSSFRNKTQQNNRMHSLFEPFAPETQLGEDVEKDFIV
jgi:hypothetical protein